MKLKEAVKNENVLMIIIVVLVVILAVAVFFPSVNTKSGKISAKVILLEGCDDCFDIGQFVEILRQQDVEIKEIKNIDYKSREGAKLVGDYGLEKIPAFIVKSRDIDKINFRTLDNSYSGKNYFVFNNIAPYIDLPSGQKKGMVSFIEIQDGCVECGSVSSLAENMKSAGLKEDKYEVVNSNSERGKELIAEHNLTFIPSLLIDSEFSEYWWIIDGLQGRIEKSGDYFVVKSPSYPYKDLKTGMIKGKVKATYLINKSCEECFDPSSLGGSFKNMGVYFSSEKEVDVSSSEGKKIIYNYNITLIPTIIFSKEILDYKEMEMIFEQIGTIEKDSSFVFRKIKELNVNYQEVK